MRCHYALRNKDEHKHYRLFILHFQPSNTARAPRGAHQSPKNPQIYRISLYGHILSSYYAFAQAGALPGMSLYPLSVWQSLRFSLNVTSFMRPSLTFPGRNDHAFTVFNPAPSPCACPLYPVFTYNCIHHLFIYMSISPTKLGTSWRQRPSFISVS